jgi:hypothetical protein
VHLRGLRQEGGGLVSCLFPTSRGLLPYHEVSAGEAAQLSTHARQALTDELLARVAANRVCRHPRVGPVFAVQYDGLGGRVALRNCTDCQSTIGAEPPSAGLMRLIRALEKSVMRARLRQVQ